MWGNSRAAVPALLLIVVMGVSSSAAASPPSETNAIAGSLLVLDTASRSVFGIDGTAAMGSGSAEGKIVFSTDLRYANGSLVDKTPVGLAYGERYNISEEPLMYVAFSDGTIIAWNDNMQFVRQGDLGGPVAAIDFLQEYSGSPSLPDGYIYWVAGTDNVIHVANASDFSEYDSWAVTLPDGTPPAPLSGISHGWTGAASGNIITSSVSDGGIYSSPAYSDILYSKTGIEWGAPLGLGPPDAVEEENGISGTLVRHDRTISLIQADWAFCSYTLDGTRDGVGRWTWTQNPPGPGGFPQIFHGRSSTGPVYENARIVQTVYKQSVRDQGATQHKIKLNHTVSGWFAPDAYMGASVGLNGRLLGGPGTPVPPLTQDAGNGTGGPEASWFTATIGPDPNYLHFTSLLGGDVVIQAETDDHMITGGTSPFVNSLRWIPQPFAKVSFTLPSAISEPADISLRFGLSILPGGPPVPIPEECQPSVPIPPPPAKNIVPTYIEPIQVLRGNPLVATKETVVRVGVRLEGATELGDVAIRVVFSGETREERGNLLNFGGNTYVLNSSGFAATMGLRDQGDTSGNYSALQENLTMLMSASGIDAFNVGGLGDPFLPSAGDFQQVQVSADPDDEVVESIEVDNSLYGSVNVMPRPPAYPLQFRLATRGGHSFQPGNDWNRIIDRQKEHFIATTPVGAPDVPVTSRTNVIQWAPTWWEGWWAGSDQDLLNEYMMAYLAANYQEGARTVFVVPNSMINNISGVTLREVTTRGIFMSEWALPFTTVHEIAHTYGSCDEYEYSGNQPSEDRSECGGDWDEASFPFGYVAGDGWNPRGVGIPQMATFSKLSLDRADPSDVALNYFSYMGKKNDSVYYWTTQSNFNLYGRAMVPAWPLLASLSPKADIGSVQADSDTALLPHLLLSGIAWGNGSWSVYPAGVSMFPPIPAGSGPFTGEVRDGASSLLSANSVDLNAPTDGGSNSSSRGFVLRVPWPAEAASVTVTRAGLDPVVFTRGAPPAIVLNGFIAGDALRLFWNSTDPDSNVTVDIALSTNGTEYEPHAARLAASGTLDIPLAGLEGGTYSVQAWAQDGLDRAVDTSGPFLVPGKPPTILINAPLADSTHLLGERVTLSASVLDPEGESLDANVTWVSNLSGLAGAGGRLALRNLSAGAHRLTATVRDSTGLESNATVNISIVPRTTDLSIIAVEANETDTLVGRTVQVNATLDASGYPAFVDVVLYDGDPASGGVPIASNSSVWVRESNSTIATMVAQFWSAGSYDLWVKWQAQGILDPDPADDSLNVSLRVTLGGSGGGSYLVRGNVTDENGARPSGLSVQVCVTRTGECIPVLTGPGGYYEADLLGAPGGYIAGDTIQVTALNSTSGMSGGAFATVLGGTVSTWVDVVIASVPEVSAGVVAPLGALALILAAWHVHRPRALSRALSLRRRISAPP